eukprot:scaffold1862_cov268-Chaetoceros_neogracile.AAC.47
MFSIASRTAMRTMRFTQVKVAAPASTSFLSAFRAFSEEAGDTLAGHVKWFDVKKGFGFITPTDGGEDVFVHQTVINSDGFRSLADGEEVRFNIHTDETGRKRAADVTGPDGGYVQGAPKRRFDNDSYDSY